MASADQQPTAGPSTGASTVPDGPTVASQIPFVQLCGFLEKVQKKKGSDAKKLLFKEFLEKWREFHKVMHVKNPNTVRTNDLL